MFRIAQLYAATFYYRVPRLFGILYLSFYKILYPNFQVGSNAKIWGKFFITIYESNGSIAIGDNLRLLSSNPRSLIASFFHSKLTVIGSGSINIGSNASLNGVAITSMNKISIGDNVMIAPNVIIVDTDFHKHTPIADRQLLAPKSDMHNITIESNVWIGASAIILKGVRIGKNSVISAGSVVSRDIPANVIASGNPALEVAKLD